MKYYVKSYAKINLSLNVYKPKGINSLHPIESLFQEVSLYDEIEITPIKTTTVDYTITYSGFTIPTNSKNIIGKIIETLAPNLNYSYQIHINKKIPLGSGMGGASSNAAIILKAINTIEKKEWSYEELLKISKQFGSDISFFLKGGLQHVSGIGDKLTPKKNKTKQFFTIIYPNIECSTKEIYAHFDKLIDKNYQKITQYSNYLLPVVLDYNKEMATIYKALANNTSSPIQLTGSGSTFFIETGTKKENLKLKEKLLKTFPNYYIQDIEALYNEQPLTLV